MILSNFHTHTVFCDGSNTIQEYIDAALALGFHSLGFSGHGYVPCEGLYSGMTPEGAAEYLETINMLKGKYESHLQIFAGLENDSANMLPVGCYDYTIGSVHSIKCGNKYYSVDSKAVITDLVIAVEFGGDGLAYAEAYYSTLSDFASLKRADILGHIDLIRRFNTVDGQSVYFDEWDKKYRLSACAALEQAVRSDYIIEVNTAPIHKGFSDEAYPSRFLLELAKELGARIIVNSDAHFTSHLNFAFEKVEKMLRDIGFKERWELTRDGFQPVKI